MMWHNIILLKMTLFGHLIKVFAGNWVYFDVLFIVQILL